MNTQFTIDGLFPTPIISSNINRSWTEKELALFDYHKDHCHNNMGNTTSNDRYVLNAPEAKGLVGFIGQGIQHYVDKIICPKNPVEFYHTILVKLYQTRRISSHTRASKQYHFWCFLY